MNAKRRTLLPLTPGRLRSLRGSASVSQGGSGTCFSGDFPSCPHLLCLGLHHGAVSAPGVLSARAEPTDVLQEFYMWHCSSHLPSPGYRQGFSPQHQFFLLKICSCCTYLLMWSWPKYSIAGVREPCGGGKPSWPALRVTPLKPAI